MPIELVANSVAGVNYDSQMPLDPFANDPNDPASFLDPDEPAPPLSDEERLHITQDLALVARFREELTPEGMSFTYRIMDGPSDTKNAIALLAQIGFPDAVTVGAADAVKRFEETHSWTERS